MTEQKQKVFILAGIFLLLAGTGLSAAAPLVYVIPDSRAVHIILGDVPRNVAGFTVARKDKGSKDFRELTGEPVQPLSDPVEAVALMGTDYSWIARRIGVEKPSRLWRRLQADRNTALSLCLVSPGLRLALGRTLVDVSVVAGEEYTYRVDLLDLNEHRLKRITKTVRTQQTVTPQPVKKVTAEFLTDEIKLTWDYAAYRGSENDLTVSFNIYRSIKGKKPERINTAPVLRVEGWLSYLDNAVEYGTDYTYSVEPVDLIGTTGERILSAPVTPVDHTAPLVPMGLTAVDAEKGVRLLWRIAPEPDAAAYQVFRSEKMDTGYKKINTEPVPYNQTAYLDADIQRGICYYYRITALDRSGNESPQSGPAVIIPRDNTAPGKLDQLSAAVDAKKLFVALTWQASTVPDLNGYHVYRGKSKSELTRITAAPVTQNRNGGYTDTGFKDRGLYPGDTLVYAVTAVDSSFNEGEKAYAEVIIPDNKPPSAVFAFSGRTTAEGAVSLTWQPSLSRDLALHRIFRKGDKEDKDFVQITELAAKVTGWEDKEVTRGNKYSYRIVEVDTSGNQSKPSAVVSVIPTDLQPPAAPAGVTAVLNSRGVQLSWKAVTASDLAGYFIYRRSGGTGTWKLLTAKPESRTAYQDKSGKAGDVYALTAVDTSANESKRNTITVKQQEKGK